MFFLFQGLSSKLAAKLITRSKAKTSVGHRKLVNYLDNISRDESGAPVRWTFNKSSRKLAKGISKKLAKVDVDEKQVKRLKSKAKKMDVGEETAGTSEGSGKGKKSVMKKSKDGKFKKAMTPDSLIISIRRLDDSKPGSSTMGATERIVTFGNTAEGQDQASQKKQARPRVKPINKSKKLPVPNVLKPDSKSSVEKSKDLMETDSEVDTLSNENQKEALKNLEQEVAIKRGRSNPSSWTALNKKVMKKGIMDKMNIKNESRSRDSSEGRIDSDLESVDSNISGTSERKKKMFNRQGILLGPKKLLRSQDNLITRGKKTENQTGFKRRKRTLSGEFDLLDEVSLKRKLRKEQDDEDNDSDAAEQNNEESDVRETSQIATDIEEEEEVEMKEDNEDNVEYEDKNVIRRPRGRPRKHKRKNDIAILPTNEEESVAKSADSAQATFQSLSEDPPKSRPPLTVVRMGHKHSSSFKSKGVNREKTTIKKNIDTSLKNNKSKKSVDKSQKEEKNVSENSTGDAVVRKGKKMVFKFGSLTIVGPRTYDLESPNDHGDSRDMPVLEESPKTLNKGSKPAEDKKGVPTITESSDDKMKVSGGSSQITQNVDGSSCSPISANISIPETGKSDSAMKNELETKVLEQKNNVTYTKAIVHACEAELSDAYVKKSKNSPEEESVKTVTTTQGDVLDDSGIESVQQSEVLVNTENDSKGKESAKTVTKAEVESLEDDTETRSIQMCEELITTQSDGKEEEQSSVTVDSTKGVKCFEKSDDTEDSKNDEDSNDKQPNSNIASISGILAADTENSLEVLHGSEEKSCETVQKPQFSVNEIDDRDILNVNEKNECETVNEGTEIGTTSDDMTLVNEEEENIFGNVEKEKVEVKTMEVANVMENVVSSSGNLEHEKLDTVSSPLEDEDSVQNSENEYVVPSRDIESEVISCQGDNKERIEESNLSEPTKEIVGSTSEEVNEIPGLYFRNLEQEKSDEPSDITSFMSESTTIDDSNTVHESNSHDDTENEEYHPTEDIISVQVMNDCSEQKDLETDLEKDENSRSSESSFDHSMSSISSLKGEILATPVATESNIEGKAKRQKKVSNTTTRTFQLRQKASRSPLEIIAMRQSEEEKQYMLEQSKRAIKREEKQKKKLHKEKPLFEIETQNESLLLQHSQDDSFVSNELETEKEISQEDETDDEIVEQPTNLCKPCSVVLIDFVKYLKMNETTHATDGESSAEDSGNAEEVTESENVEKSADLQQMSEGKEVLKDVASLLAKGDSPQQRKKRRPSARKQAKSYNFKQKFTAEIVNYPLQDYDYNPGATVPPLRLKIKPNISPEPKKKGGKQVKRKARKSFSPDKPPSKIFLKEHDNLVSATAVESQQEKIGALSSDGFEGSFVQFIKEKNLPVKPSCQQDKSPPAKTVVQKKTASPVSPSVIERKQIKEKISSAARKEGKFKGKNEDNEQMQFECTYNGCGFQASRREVIKAHIYVHLKNTPFKCLHCNGVFKTRTIAFMHSRSEHQRMDIKIEPAEFVDETQYFKHISSETSLTNKPIPIAPKPVAAIPLAPHSTSAVSITSQYTPAVVAPNATPPKQIVQAEVQQVEQSPEAVIIKVVLPNVQQPKGCYSCSYCNFSSSVQQEILTHINENHRPDIQYTCSICSKVFLGNKEGIASHFAQEHPNQPILYKSMPDFYDSSKPTSQPSQSVTSGPDKGNIFDRMSDLFSPQEHSGGYGKKMLPDSTSAEADSTTAESDLVQNDADGGKEKTSDMGLQDADSGEKMDGIEELAKTYGDTLQQEEKR